MSEPILQAEAVGRAFSGAAGTVHACRDVSITVHPGELVVLRGSSGSGKTTVLNLLAGIDTPSTGRVLLDGRDLAALSREQLDGVRRVDIGYVVQSFGLIPVLTAAENVEIPLRSVRTPTVEREQRVAEALELVGMSSHSAHRPEELSGGQQQRIGIARAIVNRPRIILADEPTGQLDAATAASVMDLFAELVRSRGVAAVIATHDPLLMARADRVVELHGGTIGEAVRRRSVPLESVSSPS